MLTQLALWKSRLLVTEMLKVQRRGSATPCKKEISFLSLLSWQPQRLEQRVSRYRNSLGCSEDLSRALGAELLLVSDLIFVSSCYIPSATMDDIFKVSTAARPDSVSTAVLQAWLALKSLNLTFPCPVSQLPALPKNATKRKLEAPVMPDVSAYKSVKLDGETSASSNGKGKGRVTIEDVSDEDDDSARAGDDENDFAPGGDADYFEEEDEDGRFLCVRPATSRAPAVQLTLSCCLDAAAVD